MKQPITLSHYDHGPVRVTVWDEASFWMKRRTWTCVDNPELGSFEDEDFDEHYTGQISEIIAAATISTVARDHV